METVGWRNNLSGHHHGHHRDVLSIGYVSDIIIITTITTTTLIPDTFDCLLCARS